MGTGAHLKKRLKRGGSGINRLDKIVKQHDIDYRQAKNLQDKWKADQKMIKAIDRLPGSKTMTESLGLLRRLCKPKKDSSCKLLQNAFEKYVYKESSPSCIFILYNITAESSAQ